MIERSWPLTLALGLLLGACHDPQPSPAPTPGAETPTDAPTAPPAAAAPTAGAAPPIERPLAPRLAVERKPVTLEIDAVETVGGAVYLRALVPPDPQAVVIGPVDDARIEVLGPRYGLAVPATQGRLSDRPLLYVRLVGDAPPPDPLRVRWYQPASLDGDPGQIQELELVGASSATPFPRLAPRVYEAMARWFTDRRGPPYQTPFGAFAAGRLLAVGQPESTRRSRQVNGRQLMQLDTAPFEAGLMFDRGLRLPPEMEPGPPVAMDTLAEPPRVGHPWETLLAALPAPPKIEPLAAWAPEEWIYLHLADLATGLALYDEAEALFGPLADAAVVSAGARAWVEQSMAQMGLDRATLTALGPLTGAVALMASDPLPEATPALVLAIEARSPAEAAAALAAHRRTLAARLPAARAQTVQMRGRAVERLTTPDRALSAHHALVDDVLLIANSPAALDRVLAARDGDRPLAAGGDLRTLRGRLPATADEAAFLMIGEGQLARLASPRTRLLAARRARAMSDLRAVHFAGLLYGWLEGEPLDLARPADRAKLRASGLLSDADLVHDDGGKITLDDGGRACSARWGCAGAGRPTIEIEPTPVTASEAGAWNRMRAEWSDGWRARVAPLGVRIRRTADGYALDGQMLPLVQRHAYTLISETLGGAPVGATRDGPGIELAIALAADAPQRAQLDGWLEETTGQRDVGLDWLGGALIAGVGDTRAVWEAVLLFAELPNRDGRRAWRVATLRKQVIDRLPLYLIAEVADRPALDRALVAGRAALAAIDNPITWSEAAPHRGVPTFELREVLSPTPESRIGLWYGVTGDRLVIGLERAAFEAALDRVLDGAVGGAVGGASSTADGPARAALGLRFGPEGWLQRAVAGAIESFAIRRLGPARRSFEAAARGLTLPAPGPERDDALRAALGLVPAGPHGDRPEMRAGEVALPRYGTPTAPTWPALPVTGGGDIADRLLSLDASLGFAGPPGQTALHLSLSWRRRP